MAPRDVANLPEAVDSLRAAVVGRHAVEPRLVRAVRAPYRVCPIGAHVDHQLGPVTAMAIDRGVYLAYAPSPPSAPAEVRLDSLDFPGSVRFTLGEVPPRQGDDWGNFPRGAVAVLRRHHRLERGLVGVVVGQLHGGGVSSSAAVGIAYLLAFADVNGLSLSAAEQIKSGRRIENDYLGLRCGVLDQAAIVLSRRDHLTRIDCRTSAHELIPAARGMPPYRFVLAFSGVRKPLTGTDYNRRVGECAEAARTLLAAGGRSGLPPVLGLVPRADYEEHRHRLGDVAARRAAHFYSEVDRVERGTAAWRAGNLADFGALMTASGASSIRNYESGSPPLIDLYETLVATEGVYGARFSGAGFRGCCVALVDPAAVERVAARVTGGYARRYPDLADHVAVVACASDDGAALLDDPAPPSKAEHA
jgi:galacturonokinase